MPMSRYEIRNEYSLADPELYRAADKDDPEALLEGVAMAGLVGVLRQLGDLAEFAAEIFRDLHEEVMATAARGHGLMVRVQQLESDVPFIEKALISQTNHSSFFYNSGVDWHPNEKMDQNVITQGDLPRFVMDSYEECRGPPRLFLLDKFDIAGAGACLKRYTDPSFFKVEVPTSGMASTDVQREKKARKAKKKGPRWRHGETPEAVFPTAHAKLHQLFLEEHVQNGVGNPARRAKLKRKLNGFPFNLKTGKSYMEKLFDTSSPEHKVVHEVPVRSPLKLQTNDRTEIVPKVLEVRTVSPDTQNEGRERTPTSSLDGAGPTLQLSIYERNEISTDEKISEVSRANPSYEADESSSSLHRETNENGIAVDEEIKTEGTLDGYQSDDIASERDNYVDATSTMDSEMETDSELRGKSDLVSLNIKRQLSTSDSNEDQLQGHASDSQSVVTSTLSDDGNNSSKKEISSFSLTATPSTSAENSPSDCDAYAEVSPSTKIPETNTSDRSSHQQTGDGEVSVSQDPNAVPDNTCFGTVEIPGYIDFPHVNSSSCVTDVIPTSIHLHSESLVGKGRVSHADEMFSACNEVTHELVNTDHNGAIVVKNMSHVSSSPSAAQIGDDSSPRLSTENNQIDESNGIMSENVPIMSTISDVRCHARDHSQGMSGEYLDRNDSDVEDLNLHENVDQLHMVSTENAIPCMVDKEFPNTLKNSMSDHSETFCQQNDGCTPVASEEKHSVDELDDKKQNLSFDACNNLSYIREAAPEKANSENSLDDMAQTVGASDDFPCSLVDSQFSSQNPVSVHTEENSFYLPQKDFELHDAGNGDASANKTATKDIQVVENHKSSGSSVLQAPGIKDNDCPPDVADMESSHASDENLDEPVTTSNAVEVDGTDLTGKDGTHITVFVDPASPNEVHIQLNEVDTEADHSVPAPKSTTVSATENNSDVIGVEVDGIHPFPDLNAKDAKDVTVSPDAASLNAVQAQLDAIGSEEDQSGAAVMATIVAGTENDSNEADVSSSVDLKKSQEECTRSSGELDQNELETEMKCLPGSHRESGLAKDVLKQEAATSGLDSFLCSSPVDYDDPKSELFATDQHSYLDLEVENSLDTFNATPIQSSLEQNCLAVEQESCRQGGLIDLLEDASTGDIGPNAEETSVEGKINLLPSQPDLEDLPDTGEDYYEEVPHLKEVQNLDHNAHEGSSDTTSKCLLVNIQNQPSVAEIPVQSSSDVNMSAYPKDTVVSTVPPLSQPSVLEIPVQGSSDVNFNMSAHPQDTLVSTFPPVSLLSEANPINLDELPPLPPLPPVQWRMGKHQHASAPGRVAAQENISPILSALPMFANQNTQKPILPAVTREGSPSVEEYSSGNIVHSGSLSSQVPNVYHPSNTESYSLVFGGIQSTNSFSMLPEQHDEEPQDSFLLGKGSTAESRLTSFSQDASIDTASTNDIGLSHEVIRPLDQVAPGINPKEQVSLETSSKEEKVESGSSGVEVNTTRPEAVELLPKIPALVMPSSEGENTLPPVEGSVTNGSRTMKQPRPRNPLIDAVVARDKSKLRKVTERIMPEIQKVDERDSLLEQIRTKSFNLKPAVVSRPSIQGPKTNLKVAAILEKANAIRQAFAGSDDDDDDSWSDS